MRVAGAAFEGPDLFLISTPDDPKDQAQTCEELGLAPGITAYAEPIVKPSTCPECECSPASCSLPEEMHASAAKCPGDGAVSTPFDASPGWEGTCDDSSPIAADLPCGGGACVESLSISALTIEPCQSTQSGQPEIPAPAWGTTVHECHLTDLHADGCGLGEVCVPSVPPSYTLCLWAKGIHECGDEEYPRRIIVYDTVKDDRACSPCACGDQKGAECSAFFSVFTDDACSKLLATVTIEPEQPVCVDVPSGSALGSKGAFFQVDKPGTCAPSGSELTGDVGLTGALTLCCQPELSLPG